MTTKLFKYESDLDVFGTPGTSIYANVRANYLTAGLTIGSVANEEPDADLNSKLLIRTSGTKKYGLTARHIVLQRLSSSTTTPNIVRKKVVILKPATFVTYISQDAASISFDGLEDWVLVGAESERYHIALGT